MKGCFLVLSVVLLSVLVAPSWATCPEDTSDLGQCDTMYVEPWPDDTVHFGEGPYFVRVPIYVTNDLVEIPGYGKEDSIAAFVLPLYYTHSNPSAYCSLGTYWNATSMFWNFPDFDRSIFRHIVDGADTLHHNRMADLAADFSGREWDWVALDLENDSSWAYWNGGADSAFFPPHFRLAVAASGVQDQRWWEASKVLLATITFKVEDSMEVCIDTGFWPPSGRLSWVRDDAVEKIPRLGTPHDPASYKACFNVHHLMDYPEVVSRAPTANEIAVPISADISVIFDSDMNATTINDSTFIVTGLCTGQHSGVVDYDPMTKTATLDPSNDFDVGEFVSVALTPGMRSLQGAPLEGGVLWSFTAEVQGGVGNFLLDSAYSVGDNPRTVCAADLDNDGDLDLVTANRLSYEISVLLNNGDGSFGSHSEYPTGDQSWALCVADFDRDGYMDVAVACGYSNRYVAVLLNDGIGALSVDNTYPVGNLPYSVMAADLDGDGDQDLATGNCYSASVSVLLNNGHGTFAAHTQYPTGDNPWAIKAADLDGDDDLDLVTAGGDSNTVSVLSNNGHGAFPSYSMYSVSGSPFSLSTADFDGDADIDLAAGCHGSDSISLLLNGGDGTLIAGSAYWVGDAPLSVFAADLDADSDMDLAVANLNGNGVSILLNDGGGTFDSLFTCAAGEGPRSIFAADLDEDGDLDLTTANGGSDDVSVLLNQVLWIRGDANGSGIIELGDVVFLITYLYKNGPAPVPLLSGDANCSGLVELGDVVHLITYLYKNGPPPAC